MKQRIWYSPEWDTLLVSLDPFFIHEDEHGEYGIFVWEGSITYRSKFYLMGDL